MDINNTFRIPIKKQKPRQINSIVALGNPMVDIIAEVDEELLHQFNLRKSEINYATNENSDLLYANIKEICRQIASMIIKSQCFTHPSNDLLYKFLLHA